MHKFNSIDALRHARLFADKFCGSPKVDFVGSIKVHGSNMGVVCGPEGYSAQSRRNPITPENDCYGFATWLATPEVEAGMMLVEARIRNKYNVAQDETLVIYGEWAGPGVQSGVGVCKLARKTFFIFDAAVIREVDGQQEQVYLSDRGHPFSLHIREKEELRPALDVGIDTVHDAEHFFITVDFSDEAAITTIQECIDRLVAQVEQNCPVADMYDVDGVGEGIVWRPCFDHVNTRDLMFKSKGAKHKVHVPKGGKEPIAPEVLAGTAQFCDSFVTEGRLEQGMSILREDLGCEPTRKATGAFLKWVGQDVQKEGRAELEASGLSWKQVQGEVSKRAREWFFKRV